MVVLGIGFRIRQDHVELRERFLLATRRLDSFRTSWSTMASAQGSVAIGSTTCRFP